VARLNQIIAGVTKLQSAVKFAREEANTKEIAQQSVGAGIFRYLFS
jgi:hypothetical protein